jgi:hypothetical protein
MNFSAVHGMVQPRFGTLKLERLSRRLKDTNMRSLFLLQTTKQFTLALKTKKSEFGHKASRSKSGKLMTISSVVSLKSLCLELLQLALTTQSSSYGRMTAHI